jgi:signal transduction histidine kinase
VAIIDPRRIPKNPVPALVHIQQIVSNGKPLTDIANPTIANGSKDLEVDYVGLSFVNPAKVRYRYKLEGYDQEWVDAGTRRQAFYSNLRPRNYKFQVCACNNDGVWNETGDSVEFSIRPTFYETGWFYALCALSAGVLLFGLHRLRQAQLAARLRFQFESQQRERTRIAQELHDTLLQGFTGIGLKLEVLCRSLPDSLAGTKVQLKKILQQSDRYLAEARGAVWKLRSPTLEKEDVLNALSESAKRLLENTGIELQFSTNGVPRQLAPMIEENLLRICEEAVSNAVKHAHASRVDVCLSFSDKELCLRVWDNGCGFNPHGSEASKEGHFGLVGIQERVKASAGRVAIKSVPGAGTELLVTMRV